MRRQQSPDGADPGKGTSRLFSLLRSVQTGHVINTMWASEGTALCRVQMSLVKFFLIWPLKAVAPLAYMYWAWRLMRSLSGRATRSAQPQGALAILRAAVTWGLQESFSFLLGLEVFFYLYYRYKHAALQADIGQLSLFLDVFGRGRWWVSKLLHTGHARRCGTERSHFWKVQLLKAIKSCRQSNCWEFSLQLLHVAELTLDPDLMTYNSAAASITADRWWMSADIISTLRERLFEADVITYGSAIAACKQGLWFRSVALLAALKRHDLEDDIVAWGSTVGACAPSTWQQCLHLLSKLDFRGHAASSRVYVTAMSSFRERWQQAAQLLRAHDLVYAPSLPLFNSFLAALENCGQWQRALHFVLLVRDRACEPDITTYNTAMSACAAASCWKLALILMDCVENSKLHPDVITHNAAITACANAGLWKRALALMVGMKGQKSRISFNAALHACAGSAAWEQGLAVFALMERADIAPDAFSHTAVLSAIGRAQRWPDAVVWFRNIRASCRPSLEVYNAILDALEKGGEWQSALRMLWEIEAEEGLKADLVSYSSVSSACDKGCAWQPALQVLQELKPRALRADVLIYSTTLGSCDRVSKWKWNLHVFSDLRVDRLGGDAICFAAAVGSAAVGFKWLLAMSLVDALSQRTPSSTFSKAVTACEYSGCPAMVLSAQSQSRIM
ncbi:unnamed protein product [Symbiodinium natans]|uniref:Pentatricopeptide repeat-containing protein, chloroplastic n=1 Tax=Symbiodinium natans TaxID=878477 RepID=A0A812TW55_9DINO|nr:unnamed protein product [Symbiodinium natans]